MGIYNLQFEHPFFGSLATCDTQTALISSQLGGTVANASLFLELDCVRSGAQSSRKMVGLREPGAHASKM